MEEQQVKSEAYLSELMQQNQALVLRCAQLASELAAARMPKGTVLTEAPDASNTPA